MVGTRPQVSALRLPIFRTAFVQTQSAKSKPPNNSLQRLKQLTRRGQSEKGHRAAAEVAARPPVTVLVGFITDADFVPRANLGSLCGLLTLWFSYLMAFAKTQECADLYAVSQIARHEEMHAGANGEGRSFHLADFQSSP
jgi:hypothetical protein